MRLNGKVNTIKRTVARHGRRDDAKPPEEKRVYGLTVRLPDKSLEADYNYGYGSMSFILHGHAMADFVDLDAEVDVYVVPRGQGEVPQREFEDMRTRIYELEGDLANTKASSAVHKERADQHQKENHALHQRLSVAMNEVMRLEARLGQEPPKPLEIEHEGEEA
jgi:hypothetical protein